MQVYSHMTKHHMGILNFHQWLEANHPGAIKKVDRHRYHNIFIDVNFMLHKSIYGCRTEEQFFNNLCFNFDFLLSNFIAIDHIIFAIDGPASYGKLMVQRQRRAHTLGKIDKLSSIGLTPGTELMQRVEARIQEYVDNLRYYYVAPHMEIIQSRVPNEGDIKIAHRLLQYGPEKRNLVISNDADLVIIGMSLQPVTDIDIFFHHQTKVELIHLHELKENVHGLDFAFLSILMGNDYFPKLAYGSFDLLWKTYTELQQHAFDRDNRIMTSPNEYHPENLLEFLYIYILQIPPQYQKIRINHYSPTRIQNYIEGILWCMNMYGTGECSAYDYVCHTTKVIWPAEIILYLETQQFPQLPISVTPSLSADAISIILLPKGARHFIPKHLHPLMDNQLSFLYSSEDCDECKTFKETLNDHNKQLYRLHIQKNPANKPHINILKQKVIQQKALFDKHKKQTRHSGELVINDIQKITQLL